MRPLIPVVVMILFLIVGCAPSSDTIQADQQEKMLLEATAQTGMPSIKNYRERKIMKDILELRDQEGYSTYSYTYSEVTGKYAFFCDSVGYPIPYSTQYTNPQKESGSGYSLPQADPNGLFSPASAEGTWIMCKNPASDQIGAVYSEPKVTTLPWPLPGVENPFAPAEL